MAICYDTNILLHIARDKSRGERIRTLVNPERKVEYISIVSAAELQSLAEQNGWGERRKENIRQLLGDLNIVNIEGESIIEQYVNIDVFSQGKHKMHRLIGSARNMGKNDLWIAATACILQFELITTDKDFSHLQSFFEEKVIPPETLT